MDAKQTHDTTKTYDCAGCRYLNGTHCLLWQVEVKNPIDAHCESHQVFPNGTHGILWQVKRS